MLEIDDPVEFADLLDRLNIDSEREAYLVEADTLIDESTAREGIRFWRRHYQAG